MMHIDHTQATALAAFVGRIRPDWDHPGIVAAIGKARSLGSAAAIGAALCRLAENRELRTPAMLAEPGTHWSGTTVAKLPPPIMCAEHPHQPARECPDCRAQAVTDKAALADLAAAVRAHHKTRTRHTPRPEPTPDRTRIEQIRAELDREATT